MLARNFEDQGAKLAIDAGPGFTGYWSHRPEGYDREVSKGGYELHLAGSGRERGKTDEGVSIHEGRWSKAKAAAAERDTMGFKTSKLRYCSGEWYNPCVHLLQFRMRRTANGDGPVLWSNR